MLKQRVAIKEFFYKEYCDRDVATSNVTVGITTNIPRVKKLKAKFIEEAQSVFAMKHPNIVNVYDVFEENGTAYYVMDYIDGCSLNDIVKREGSISEHRAVGYIRQVAGALRYVHSLNRLHLDIKPGNIMIDRNGKAVLIDFGASKLYDEDAGENNSTLLGKTPGYAPLEQMGNNVVKFSPSTDIYALGATLYKLLTGQTPPSANLLATGDKLEPLPLAISENVRNAVYQSLKTMKIDRPQSIDEFLAILGASPIVAEESDEIEIVVDSDEIETVVDSEENASKDVKVDSQRGSSDTDNNIGYGILGIIFVAAIVWGVVELKDYIKKEYNSYKSKNQIVKKQNPLDRAISNIEAKNEQIITETVNGVEFNMVLVNAGIFTMGATLEQGSDAKDDEKPTHKVMVGKYYIGQTEVTQKLWQAVMGTNPSNFKGDDLPVESVSWIDCQEFIKKLNELTGKTFRLPTEAEWEFAARGGLDGKGYKYSGSNVLGDVAKHEHWSVAKTYPVATMHANELGIYDMSGNVREWCYDWYGDYDGALGNNPKGPISGTQRVERGGNYMSDAQYCRVSSRGSDEPTNKFASLGLRLALTL